MKTSETPGQQNLLGIACAHMDMQGCFRQGPMGPTSFPDAKSKEELFQRSDLQPTSQNDDIDAENQFCCMHSLIYRWKQLPSRPPVWGGQIDLTPDLLGVENLKNWKKNPNSLHHPSSPMANIFSKRLG